MTIYRRDFPNRFAILPSDTYRFGIATQDDGRFRIVFQADIPDGTTVAAINAGLLAFDFTRSSSLGGFSILEFQGSGNVPEEVMENRETMLKLQAARMKIATFVSACIFGVHASETHSSVEDALFPGLDEVYSWDRSSGVEFDIPALDTARLVNRLARRTSRPTQIPEKHVAEGLELSARLLAAQKTYQTSDPIALMVMTYQAMILHSRQHAGASIALQALVAEATVEELVYACGLVKGVPARLSISSGPLIASLSKNQAKDLAFGGAVQILDEAGVLNSYLVMRIDALRRARNALMHDVRDPTPKQSGEGLTVLRDLLILCTGERSFELTMPWSYRF